MIARITRCGAPLKRSSDHGYGARERKAHMPESLQELRVGHDELVHADQMSTALTAGALASALIAPSPDTFGR